MTGILPTGDVQSNDTKTQNAESNQRSHNDAHNSGHNSSFGLHSSNLVVSESLRVNGQNSKGFLIEH